MFAYQSKWENIEVAKLPPNYRCSRHTLANKKQHISRRKKLLKIQQGVNESPPVMN